MTVNLSTTKIQYNGNGVLTTFSYTFRILEDDDLLVFVTAADGTMTTLTLNSDYTVTGAGNDAGGTVVLDAGTLCATGETLTIMRNMDLLQETDYVDGDAFSAESFENAADKNMMVLQQIDERLDRSICAPKFSNDSLEIDGAEWQERENKGIGFDVDGNIALLPTSLSSVTVTSASWINVADAPYNGSLTAVVAAVGGTEAVVLIASIATLSANTVVPANLEIVRTVAGRINQGAYTLTINSRFNAPNSRVFTGTGAVTFGVGQCVLYPQWWGDDSDAMFAAVASATASNAKLVVPPGTYTLEGSSSLEIDLGLMSLEGFGAIFDCSAMTATYAIQVYSSKTTFGDNSINNTHYIRGIGLLGGYDAGRHGILIGHATYERQDQIEIGDCFIQYFDRNISFTSNSWRPVFRRMTILNPVNYNTYMPTGLTNSGEVIAFSNCEIVGGTVLIGDAYQYRFDQCSLLNSPVSVGASVNMSFNSGNIESVGAVAEYKMINITGANSLVKVNDSTIVPLANLTDSIFTVAASSKLTFDGITWPGVASTHLMETTVGYKAFCDGAGTVTAVNSAYWPTAGDGESVVSKSCNELHNGDFELNNTNGWTVAGYGNPDTGTATASATAKKNGDYGVLITVGAGGDGSGGVNVSQTKKCKPGQLVVIGGWAKVASAGTGGYLTLYFLNVDGDTISYSQEAYTSTDWTWVGTTCSAYAPAGTDSVKAVLNYAGNPFTVYWDEVIMNII